MASQLVKNKWPVSVKFPDFFEVLEDCGQPEITKSKFKNHTNPVGIEVEVEGWKKTIPSLHLWECREDGSLKDSGREFVSIILSGVLIDYALRDLEDVFKWHGDLKWSHRTSIHVHVNLKELPVLKLKWLIAYYALTEPYWYMMCDEKRLGNSFCFPVCSMNPRSVVPGKNWPKYCGLNLGSSLTTFNTVEFRQMHGHEDFALYRKWIKRICEFIDYIHNTPAKILRIQMETYLMSGKIGFKEVFGGSLPENVDKVIYDNAKWVADFIQTGNR